MKPGRIRSKKMRPVQKNTDQVDGSAFCVLFYRKYCRTRASAVPVLRR